MNYILLQLNMNVFLQSLGLTIMQAVFTAPVYGLAMYWGIVFAFKKADREVLASFEAMEKRITKMENKN